MQFSVAQKSVLPKKCQCKSSFPHKYVSENQSTFQFKKLLCFILPIFRFCFLVTFGDKVTKMQKYYVIFVYILQGKITERKPLKYQKTKRRKYGTNETVIPKTAGWLCLPQMFPIISLIIAECYRYGKLKTYLGISLVSTGTKVIFRLPELFIIYLTKKNVLESGRGIF